MGIFLGLIILLVHMIQDLKGFLQNHLNKLCKLEVKQDHRDYLICNHRTLQGMLSIIVNIQEILHIIKHRQHILLLVLGMRQVLHTIRPLKAMMVKNLLRIKYIRELERLQ